MAWRNYLKYFEKYSIYVSGITFSGGEPLVQWQFIREFSNRFKEKYPDKTILVDTNLDVNPEVISTIIDYVDYFTPDIKAPNIKLYSKITGGLGDFKRMLLNLKRLANTGKVYEVRLPIVPHVTDNKEVFSEWISLVKEVFGEDIRIRIIKFRPHGVKNKFLKNSKVDERVIYDFIKMLRLNGFNNVVYLG